MALERGPEAESPRVLPHPIGDAVPRLRRRGVTGNDDWGACPCAGPPGFKASGAHSSHVVVHCHLHIVKEPTRTLSPAREAIIANGVSPNSRFGRIGRVICYNVAQKSRGKIPLATGNAGDARISSRGHTEKLDGCYPVIIRDAPWFSIWLSSHDSANGNALCLDSHTTPAFAPTIRWLT